MQQTIHKSFKNWNIIGRIKDKIQKTNIKQYIFQAAVQVFGRNDCGKQDKEKIFELISNAFSLQIIQQGLLDSINTKVIANTIQTTINIPHLITKISESSIRSQISTIIQNSLQVSHIFSNPNNIINLQKILQQLQQKQIKQKIIYIISKEIKQQIIYKNILQHTSDHIIIKNILTKAQLTNLLNDILEIGIFNTSLHNNSKSQKMKQFQQIIQKYENIHKPFIQQTGLKTLIINIISNTKIISKIQNYFSSIIKPQIILDIISQVIPKEFQKCTKITKKVYYYGDALYAMAKKLYSLFFTFLSYNEISQISLISLIPIISFITSFLFSLYIIFFTNYIKNTNKNHQNQQIKQKKIKATLSISKLFGGQKLAILINQDYNCFQYQNIQHESQQTTNFNFQKNNQESIQEEMQKKKKQKKLLANFDLINNVGNLILEDFLQAAYMFMVMGIAPQLFLMSAVGSAVVSVSAVAGAGRILSQVTDLQDKNEQLEASLNYLNRPEKPPKNFQLFPSKDEFDSEIGSLSDQQPSDKNDENTLTSFYVNPQSFLKKRVLQIVPQQN